MSGPIASRTPADEDRERRALEATWAKRPGLYGVLADVSHTTIGLRTILLAFVFFALGGLEALLMRVQLARADHHVIGPDLYAQLFTVHGSTMMFLFAVPVMQGLAIYFVPLMIGARNVAFPRLNAYAFFLFLIGGAFLYQGMFSNAGPDAGWFSYAPLSGPQYSAGKRVDTWAQLITFTEISSLCVATNIIVTVAKMRAPGMSLDKIPLFVWAAVVQSFMVIFAMPAVVVASSALALDRLVGTHFFNPAQGGDAILFQHLFWFFGHPEVYIIFLPALGMISSVIATFTQRPIVGYLPMVLALVATAFMGFGLWVHHMFATGLAQIGASFFTAASIMIAVPTGVQVFCWIATLWLGRPRLKSPLLFVLGFFVIFVAGGLSGVMLASVPLDLQVHDTFFVVAHLHYVLIGGAVFPLIGAIHMWFPKITGHFMNERAAVASFVLMFVGFNVAFFPMHQLGMRGMPRRVYTYPAATGWGPLNLLATAGVVLLAIGVLVFVVNALRSRRHGEVAGPDPWRGPTLEWATESPPPRYDFLFPPTVKTLNPMWDDPKDQPVVVGLRTDEAEVLVTRLLDAEPDHKWSSPGPSIWPFFVAIATGVAFVGVVFTPWGIPIGGALAGLALLGWFWPKGPPKDLLEEQP